MAIDRGDSMPTVLRIGEYRFFFYSLEEAEPAHIHVEHDDKVAKYWLTQVELAEAHGFRAHELNRLRTLLLEHRMTLLEAWHAHFGN